ncbi:MAG: tyrosine-type recombinase/integrase [Bacteroidaceae bacterium]
MWIESFVDYLRYERNLSEHTISGYEADLKEFERFYKGLDSELDWNNIEADVVRQWEVSIMERGNKASSVGRRLSALRTFYRFLMKRKMVNKDPAHLVRAPKKELSLPGYIREEEMNRLLDGGFFEDSFRGARDRAMILVFYTTGIRLSELTGLRLSDLDMGQMQLKVTGKRNKQRLVPFGVELAECMRGYLAQRETFCSRNHYYTESVFVDERRGGSMEPERVRGLVKQYLSQVTTQKKRSPHVLRHSFATSMLNHHADLQSVKELLGHESLSTTEVYTHTSFEELKEVYMHAHPRAK